MYMLTPYSTPIEDFAWWEGAFTNEELDALQNRAKSSGIAGQVASNDVEVVDDNVRRSEISWLNWESQNAWIFHKLSHVVSGLNSKFFHFDLTGFGEALQLTNYDQRYKGTYDWHQDFNSTISRKLTVIVQLSDASEYDGGNLEIINNYGGPVCMKKQRGLIIAFPSWTVHRVTPVTRGSRQSLVAWISGPNFK